MPYYMIISLEEMKRMNVYKSDTVRNGWAGLLADMVAFPHILVPDGIDPYISQPFRNPDTGAIEIREDEFLRAQKIEGYWHTLRDERNARLRATDWTQTLDAPLNDQQRNAWNVYRQALRDLPGNTTDPLNPTWPAPPL